MKKLLLLLGIVVSTFSYGVESLVIIQPDTTPTPTYFESNSDYRLAMGSTMVVGSFGATFLGLGLSIPRQNDIPIQYQTYKFSSLVLGTTFLAGAVVGIYKLRVYHKRQNK